MGSLRARVLLLICFAAAAWAGCSLLVEEPKANLRCKVDVDAGDEDPCPGELRCIEGRCEAPDADAGERDGGDAGKDGGGCVPNDTPEDCNGIDDDCDGDTDEGHDSDGDGVTWCGGGKKSEADCDDFDARTFPGAKERCDGRDNDCDGEADEDDGEGLCPGEQECVEQRCVTPSCLFEGSSVDCPPGTRCDPSGECVKGEGCTDASCGDNEICDAESGSCVEVGKANGQPCADARECASGTCFDAAALRLRREEGRVCGHACCSNEDCDDGEFCFSSGSGARSCLPRSLDPRPEGARDVCTFDSGCSSLFERCTLRDGMSIDGAEFVERSDLKTAVCGLPLGSAETLDLCASDAACESGVCEFPICSEPCGNSQSCRQEFGSAAYYCRVKRRGGLLSPDFAASCVLGRDEVGPGLQGEECAVQADCADAGCVIPSGEERGFCAALCCSDQQCVEGTSCQPLAFGDHYEMRCVP